MSTTPQNQTPSQTSNMPFRAKSAIVSVIVIFTVGSYYIVNALELLSSDKAMPDGALSLIITSAVLVTLLEIVLQIVLVIGAGKVEAHAERDTLVNAKASRNAHLMLRAGVVIAVISLFGKATLFTLVSIILVAFFVSEIVRFGSQIFYYQRTV